MKKILLSAAIIAATMSSCSKNEIGTTAADAPQAITFGTYVSNASSTKTATENAGEVKATFVDGDKFGVFAYYTEATDYNAGSDDPNFMFNQAVTKGGAAWTYSPLKYWPNNVNSDNDKGIVSFFAYWPMASGTNNIALNEETQTTATDPKIKFTLDQDKAVDLMWAVNGDNTDTDKEGKPFLNLTKQDSDEKISFLFKHALSRVGFSVKLADDIIETAKQDAFTTVTINSIEFGGTLNSTNIEGDLDANLSEVGVLNLNNGTANVANWTVAADVEKTQLKLETVDFDGSEDNSACKTAVFTNAATTADAAIFTTTMVNDADKYLMIIPQDFSTTKTQMRITYTVTTKDTAYGTDGVVTVVNKFVEDVDANFESGKSYTFAFEIGLNTVKVEALDPTAWADATTAVPVSVEADPAI